MVRRDVPVPRRKERAERSCRRERGAHRCSPSGPELDPEYYGEAVVPRQYFEREWDAAFELLEFITDRSRFEQAVCILRRR